jgi:hypothetical protein
MSRKRSPSAALALIAAAVLVSACGSSSPAGTGSAADSSTASAREGVKFAECMRSNGVSEFPDPRASGGFTIDEVVNGSSLDPNAPAFQQALNACRNLEPAGFTGSEWSAQQMRSALKFAQCIRANGVTDFPDPVNGQPLVDTNRIPSAATASGMSILNAAMRRCRGFVAGLVGSQR